MTIIQELINKQIINDLVGRDAVTALENGEDASIDDALVKRGVSEENLQDLRSAIFGIPKYTDAIVLNDITTKFVDEEFARKYGVLPIAYTDKLQVGITDPELPGVLDAVQALSLKNNIGYTLAVISRSQFLKGLDGYFNIAPTGAAPNGGDGVVLSDVASVTANIGKEEAIDLSKVKGGELDASLANEQVEEIVKRILRYAIDNNSSDIHIEPMEEELRIRTRIDGALSLALTLPIHVGTPLVARFKILANMKLDEKRKPQDGRFAIKLDSHKVDFRVSVLPGYYGEKIVIRILDSYRGVKPLHEIGFSENHLIEIRKALEKPYGLILISGPTGSGKTTTLYSMLSELDRKTRNVISLEDPIEFNLSDVTQSQIFPEIGYTFASGLRSILRQDPDVIMVGEIRDGETAQLAIQAALTGHLVFSTIHTNNSIGVITRLRDMGVDPYLIAPTLCIAIAQRLTHRISPSSANPLPTDPAHLKIVEQEFLAMPEETKKHYDLTRPLNEAIPSAASPTGVKGRIPVVETVTITEKLQQAILESKTEEEMWAIAQADGVVTMRQDAILKCMDGLVPFVEINTL